MNSLLVVEDDSQFRSAITRDLETHGFQVASVGSVQSALEALARRPADVVLTDLWLGGPDGLDLLKLLPSVSRRSRSIVMSANASAREHRVATELGAVEVLIKPFTQAELLRSVRRAIDCATGFQGSVHGLSLIDMLQMFHLSQRSVTIAVTSSGGPTSKLHIRSGEIIAAEHGALVGRPALRAVLATQSGTLRSTGLEEGVEQTISAPFDHLLLACLSQLDEQTYDGREVDEAPLPEFDVLADDAAEPEDAPGPERKERIDAACRTMLETVEGAVACAVLDLGRGGVVGFHERPTALPSAESLIAAAGRELFRGDVNRLASGGLQDVQLAATHHHVFGKLLAERDQAVILVTDKSVSLGLGWALLRSHLGMIERLGR